VLAGEQPVHFLASTFLHPDELQFKLDHDTQALIDRLQDGQVTELVAIARRSVV
jgi:hypothetical protein